MCLDDLFFLTHEKLSGRSEFIDAIERRGLVYGNFSSTNRNNLMTEEFASFIQSEN